MTRFCALLLAAMTHLCLYAQTTASYPVSEATVTAGQVYTIQLHTSSFFSSPYRLSVFVEYASTDAKASQKTPSTKFSCFGVAGDRMMMSGGPSNVSLTCNVSTEVAAGEYRAIGPIVIQRVDTRESKQYPEFRTPILTIEAAPPPPPPPPPPVPPPTTFPALDSATLVLTPSQTFHDGALRAKKLVGDLESHFPNGMRDSKQNRAYLIGQAENAKTLVRITTVLYARAKQPSYPTSPYPAAPRQSSLTIFDDLNARLDEVIKGLGGNPSKTVAYRGSHEPVYVLAQLPSASQSVEVQSSQLGLNKYLSALAEIEVDIVSSFDRIANTGAEKFTWSVSTTPSGAKIFYRRLNHAEEQWAGLTNQLNQQLDYARWTWRFEWNGCSVEQNPNPYRQASITMIADKKDCKVK